MRAVVQRVSRAQVTVNGDITGQIGLGLLVLLGVGRLDTEADAIYLAEKTEGNSAVANIFQQWVAPISDLGFTTVTLRNTGSTDHVCFDQVGLPGFQFIQDPRDYETRSAHTNQDTYERLSEPDLKQAAVIMAVFVYNTAERDAMLPRKPMPHPELEEQLAKPLEGIYPSAAKQ